MTRLHAMTYSVCALALLFLAAPSQAALSYDQNVTPNIIFGAGNDNGAFTVDRENGVELGLRAKLRHNASGTPENTFNSNGDGTYTFISGVAPTQSYPTAVWSFEWSINSNYDGTSAWSLDGLTYQLEMTSTNGASIAAFDPINNVLGYADHAIGTNATGNGGGTVAADSIEYASLIASNNVAQNSWKPHWYATGFDPTIGGAYTFTLSAYDGSTQVASTSMTVMVVPEPTVISLSLLGLASLAMMRRR